ncbi:hypothetical protein SLA2020_503360 [Shorea laevis]
MATNGASNAIVPFLLELDKYEDWTIFLKNYLLTQDLWDVVEKGTDALPSSDKVDQTKKNAAALHAIHITCSPYVFALIKDISSAEDAWNKLAEMHQQRQSHSHPKLSTSSVSISRTERPTANRLEWAINKGDWKTVHKIFQESSYPINRIINDGNQTALHVAVLAGAVEIAEELIQRMSETDLQIQDMSGSTALSFAARNGKKIAECLVKKNPSLLTIPDQEEYIPIVRACASGNKNLTKYLYSKTPKEFLSPDGGKNGHCLLNYTIIGKMFDISLDLLRHYPSLAITYSPSQEDSPILTLSKESSAFFSGSGLGFWRRLIYQSIKINKHSSSNDVRIPVTHQDQNEGKNIKMQGIKQIYDLKLIHTRSREVLKCMCKHITTLDHKESAAGQVFDALFQATRNGMEEFVDEMLKAKPHIIYRVDENLRSIFMCAIENRQEKIFSFFRSVDAWKHRFNRTDNRGNNCLHIAGMLAPHFQLARISGAALQMQRELQWFKEVQSIVPEWCKNARNEDGETPSDVFTKSHKELAKQGEEWMKATASSSSVVGSLIITIMFAAIFTVPGGDDRETGFPIFLGEKCFMVFLISDAISLFTASISVLMFLGILTSRYAEKDFYKSLPQKLILGLSTLIISITTMMVTFSSSLLIMLQGRWLVILPIIPLAALPVTLFMWLQFPLLVEICISTYRPGILVKTNKP